MLLLFPVTANRTEGQARMVQARTLRVDGAVVTAVVRDGRLLVDVSTDDAADGMAVRVRHGDEAVYDSELAVQKGGRHRVKPAGAPAG